MANELYHYGIPRRSGRYPYGSGERPYQDKERRRGFIIGRVKERKAKKQANELQKKRIEAIKRAREVSARQKYLDENKSRVIRSGTSKEVLQYKGQLTNQEYEQIFKRLDYEAKLSAMTPSEFNIQMKKMDNVMKNLKMVQQWTDIGTDLWNSMARIYNATEEGKKKPWAIVNKGNSPQQEKKK